MSHPFYVMNRFLVAFLALLLMGWIWSPAHAETIVFNYGPGTGLINGEGWWNNQLEFQSMADSVQFRADTPIIGYNLFTSPEPVSTAGTTFRVSFWNDNNGRPGSLLAERDVAPDSKQYLGKWATSYGFQFDVEQVNFRFDPVTLSGGTRYWVRATSIGFNIGQYAIYTPGDGEFMVYPAPGYPPFSSPNGDLMFQLVTIPEASVPAFTTLAVFMIMLKRRGHPVT
jgi:hypothetical protein